MNKKKIIIIIGILLLMGGLITGLVFLTTRRTNQSVNQPTEQIDPPKDNPEPEDLTEPQYLYDCWKEYNMYPDWYNPYRPWESVEQQSSFDYSQIMKENINENGDSITWNGNIIKKYHYYSYFNISVDLENDYNEQIDGFLTKDNIISKFNSNKKNTDDYSIESITYYYTLNALPVNIEEEQNLITYEVNIDSIDDSFENIINSLNNNYNIINLSMNYHYISKEEKEALEKTQEISSYINENNLNEYYDSHDLISNEGKYNNIQNKFSEFDLTYPIYVQGLNCNYVSYLEDALMQNTNYKNYFSGNVIDYYNNSKINKFEFSVNDITNYFWNLTNDETKENVNGVSLDNLKDLKLVIGKSYLLFIQDNSITVLSNDCNTFNNPSELSEVQKQNFADCLTYYIIDDSVKYVATSELNLDLSYFTNITLNQLSNGNFNNFEDNNIIGQNALGSSTLNIKDRKQTIYNNNPNELNYNNDGTLSLTANAIYENYNYNFIRYFDYSLVNPVLTYDYYYMNYQNYKYNSTQTEYGPAYLKYKIIIEFDAIPLEHLIEARLWNDKTDYASNHIKTNGSGKFILTIEYDNNPEIEEENKLTYTFSLSVNTKNSSNENEEKIYLNWYKSKNNESIKLDTSGNATNYYNDYFETNETSDNSARGWGNGGVNFYNYNTSNNFEITFKTNINVVENSHLDKDSTVPTTYTGTQNDIAITTTKKED